MSTTTTNILIVGASLAGAKAAETLRADGHSGQITLVGDEPARPYERPPLSKDLLRGSADASAPFVHEEGFYAEHDIDLRTATNVVAIDLDAHEARTESGDRLPFDQLLLTTGSRPRRLQVPGADLQGIHTLRTLADAQELHDLIKPGLRMVIVGAGWIGAEVAASARQLGAEVTLLDPQSVPLERVLGLEVGTVYRDLHAGHGVEIRPGTSVTGFRGATHVEAVTTRKGEIPAELVVVGIGIEPRTELAVAAGLEVDNGIVVDEHLRTSHPDVYAAGDVAAAWHPTLKRRLRIEHWSNALNQGITAGHNLAGTPTVYDRMPTFFSDQYDLGMEYVGYPTNWDRVVFRGDPATGAFLAFWLDGGHVAAAMNANIWDVGSQLADLVARRAAVTPEQLADPTVPLAEVGGATA